MTVFVWDKKKIDWNEKRSLLLTTPEQTKKHTECYFNISFFFCREIKMKMTFKCLIIVNHIRFLLFILRFLLILVCVSEDEWNKNDFNFSVPIWLITICHWIWTELLSPFYYFYYYSILWLCRSVCVYVLPPIDDLFLIYTHSFSNFSFHKEKKCGKKKNDTKPRRRPLNMIVLKMILSNYDSYAFLSAVCVCLCMYFC